MPTAEYLATLPRDPKELLDVIRDQTRGKGQSGNGQVLVFMTDVLRTHQAPADLRAALFRATALVPGIEVIQRQATIDERNGVVMGYVEESSGIARAGYRSCRVFHRMTAFRTRPRAPSWSSWPSR